MNPICLTAAGNPENQDRGLALRASQRFVLCVADGAGGRSGGMEAAIRATEFIERNPTLIIDADSCAELLRRLVAEL